MDQRQLVHLGEKGMNLPLRLWQGSWRSGLDDPRASLVRRALSLPYRTSKPVRCGSPTLGRFDSGAAPLSQSRRVDGPFIRFD